MTEQLHSVLQNILADKAREVAQLKAETTPEELTVRAAHGPRPRDFLAALRREGRTAIIAEIKRRSPSAGDLVEGLSAVEQARAYESGGAAALSVLTDGPYFGGSLMDLAEARREVKIPVLRKDFIIDPAQVYQGRAAGADAMLLIAAALEPAKLAELYGLILKLGMTPLVEVHHPGELAPVLELDPPLIGINNRNLKTLEVDLATCLAVRPLIPQGVTVVAESGITGAGDARRLKCEGLDAFLIGTALMTSGDPAASVKALAELA